MRAHGELLSDAIDRIRAAGFTPWIEYGRHLKVRWRDHAGRPHVIIIARSPSCSYARANNRALLRRLLRRAANG